MIIQPRPQIITFAILTTITIVTWVVADLWRQLVRPIPTQVESRVLEPLTPSLDKQAIEAIRKHIFFSDEEVKELVSTSSSQTTPGTETESQ